MNTSTFDPALFEQQVVEEANETTYTPVPAGEYVGFIKDYKVREIQSKIPGNPNSYVMDVIYTLQNEDVRQQLGVDELIVRGSCFLDLEGGRILFGVNKNVQLGQLRSAVGQNKAGEPWSPSMLRGAGPVKIAVTVDAPTPEGKVYNRVNSVVAYHG